MKIVLPKELRGFAYDRVLPVELNDFNVDILLPSVFFKVLSGGRDRGKINNDPTALAQYLTALAEHPHVYGFENEVGSRTLDRLIRSTLIQTARQGTARGSEQIQGFTGYTILTAKPGFPKESSTLRKVDQLIYRMMRDEFQGEGELRRFLITIFGAGLRLEHDREIDGTYDGTTDLDTMTFLSIAYLDGFNKIGVKQREQNDRPSREACPPVAHAMALDLRRYLQAYHWSIPVEALTYHLKALINFELLVYTLKLFSAVTALVGDHNTLPEAMDPQPIRKIGVTPPQIYMDFTGESSGPSRQMAIASVRGCIDLTQRFVHANLLLRQLDRYVQSLRRSPRIRQRIEQILTDESSGPSYLLSLIQLLDDPDVALHIDASALQHVDAIRRENASPGRDDEDTDDADPLIDELTVSAKSDFDRLVLLLVESQGQKIGDRVMKWFQSVGGLTKAYGVLAGIANGRGRHNWRFAPSNDFLSTLVQVAAVNVGRTDKEDLAPRPIPLIKFLDFLEERFGILIDRPLDGFDGAEYTAAAKENLRAMLRRLGQMGVFRDLSDDFTVQQLIPPYTAESMEIVV